MVGIVCAFGTHFFINAIVACCIGGLFFYKNSMKNRVSFAIFLLFFTVGFFYYHGYLQYQKIKITPLITQSIIEGRVESEPIQKNKNRSFVLRTQSGGSVLITGSIDDDINYGDIVVIKGGKRIKSETFPRLIIVYPNIQEIRHEKAGSIGKIIGYKNAIFSIIKTLLPSQESALAIGLLFGDTSGFTNTMKEVFQKSGTTHIVALSGYNITIIASMLSAIFVGVMGRGAVKTVTILIVTVFVVITGATPSAVRAAAMVTAVILATELGRKTTPLTVMLYAGSGMLVYDPTIIFYSVGFQLSFVSLLGIMLTSRAISNILSKTILSLKKHDVLCETIAVSGAAYLATAPIILWYFGGISLGSIFVNTVIVPTVPVAMLAVAMLSVVGLCSISSAWPIALITFFILNTQILFITQSTQLPLFLTFESAMVLVGVSAIFIGALIFLYRYQKTHSDV